MHFCVPKIAVCAVEGEKGSSSVLGRDTFQASYFDSRFFDFIEFEIIKDFTGFL